MYETEVSRGISFLEGMVKEGRLSMDWFHNIDLDRLEMRNTRDCVLGQLFDHMTTERRPGRAYPYGSGFDYVATEFMDNDMEYIEAHGFDARYNGTETSRNYDELEDAWTSKILEMREAFPRD